MVHLHGGRVNSKTHGVEAVVDIHCHASHANGERRAHEEGRGANIVRVEVACERRVGLGVVDSVLDERLGALLTNSRSGARLERPSRDGVDADSVSPARLPREGAGVALQLSLGRRHATAVARDNTLRGDVGEREGGASVVHDRAELLHQGDERVGRRRRRHQVSVAAGLEQRLHHLRSVGERVNEDVNLAIVSLDSLGHLRDRVALKTRVALVVLGLLRHIIGSIENGVKRVHLVDLHFRAVREDRVLFELAAVERLLENTKHRRPGSDGHGGASVREGLGDGPSVAGRVGDARDESGLAL
mmetsp:Transcript_34130/g.58702  ORF Transcript_34130/g.58702 Transcript_34130/m.58702 type:complete len:302 (+) Transcript_34130:217-1122(+)